MRREHFTGWRAPQVGRSAPSALVAAYVVAVLVAGPISHGVALLALSYATIGVTDLQGARDPAPG